MIGSAQSALLYSSSSPAPQFNSSPQITRLSFNSFAVVGSINMSGNIYIYTIADGGTAPTSLEVKTSGISQAGAYFNIEQGSLSESTAYDCYVVAENSFGVLQATPTKIDVTTTENLNTILGSALKLWVNSKSMANKTLSGDFSQLLDGFTTDESTSPSTFTEGGSGTTKFNGKTWFMQNTYQTMADKSKLNFLHNGNAWTIAFRVMIVSSTSTSLLPILCNNNSTTAKTGISVAYDNNGTADRQLRVTVSKSSAGNNVLSIAHNNFFTDGTWATVVLKYDGVNTLTAYRDGSSIVTATTANLPFAATDASDDFFIGALSTTLTTANNILLKDIIITNTSLSDGDRGTVEAYLAKGSETLGTGGLANCYIMNGQSNMSGSPTSPPAYLQDPMNTYLWSLTNSSASITSAGTFVKLNYPDNQNTGQTSYGPELEFGYRMSVLYPKMTFLLKYAVSGTPLFVDAGGNDWNNASGVNDCAEQTRRQIDNALLVFKYALDRQPIFRGWMWSQGEGDSDSGNANYQSDLYATFNSFIDRIYTDGYTSEKGRGVISLVDQVFSPPRANQAAILQDQNDFVADYFTDNPTYVTKWLAHDKFSNIDMGLSDGVHFDDNAMVARGFRFFERFKNYISE